MNIRPLRQVLPPTALERDLALQCVLSAFATGSFMTGTAVFFTQVVGLNGAQIGLGMSVAGVVTLALSVPLGRLSDRMGAKALWAMASFVEALLYFAWPAAGGVLGFVVLLSLLSAMTLAGSTGKNVYRIAVFPRDVRVRALAHLRAARNVGFSLGALAAGVALAIGTRAVITSVPLATGAVLILNAVMVARLPSVGRQTLPAPSLAISPRWHRRPGATGGSSCCRSPTPPSSRTRSCSTSWCRCGWSSGPTRHTSSWPG